MEYRQPEFYRIFDWYKKEGGYIEVPGKYDERGCKCHLCGWENWDSSHAKTCPKCKERYNQDKRDGQFPLQLKHIEYEDWAIFHAIDKQLRLGEQPYATVDEYRKELEQRNEHHKRWTKERQLNKTSHRTNSTLY